MGNRNNSRFDLGHIFRPWSDRANNNVITYYLNSLTSTTLILFHCTFPHPVDISPASMSFLTVIVCMKIMPKVKVYDLPTRIRSRKTVPCVAQTWRHLLQSYPWWKQDVYENHWLFMSLKSCFICQSVHFDQICSQHCIASMWSSHPGQCPCHYLSRNRG